MSDAKKVRCWGRGLQPQGVRIGDDADFRIQTLGAGEGNADVRIIGPGNRKQNLACSYPFAVNRQTESDMAAFTVPVLCRTQSDTSFSRLVQPYIAFHNIGVAINRYGLCCTIEILTFSSTIQKPLILLFIMKSKILNLSKAIGLLQQ